MAAQDSDEYEKEVKLPNPALVNALKFVSVVYLMTILVLGIVFPISFLLRGGIGVASNYYLWIFYIYLAVVGVAFLIYVAFKLRQLKEKPNFDEDNASPSVYAINGPSIKKPQNEMNNEREKQLTPQSSHSTLLVADNIQEHHEELEHESKASLARARAQAPVQHGGPGVNFFLRLGAIGFALGTMLLDALRITQYFQTPSRDDCYGPLYLVQCGSRLVFVMIETHFLFKHHKLIINFQHGTMWFGLMHLIATNLVMWIGAVVVEAYEGFHASAGHGDGGHGDEAHNSTTTSPHHSVHKRETAVQCEAIGLSLFQTVSPYLYALVIEFALIAAAILYKLVINIGALVDTDCQERESVKKHQNHECHKATSGVMTGLVVFTTMFAVTLAFMLSEDEEVNNYLYVGGDLAVHVIALVAAVFSFNQIRKLSFAGDAENPIDEYLIVICLAGLYFLTGAKQIAAFDALGGDPDQDQMNILLIVHGFVVFAQSTFQVIFIIDSFRREATTLKQQLEKPGRSLISFLLFCNLAMWLVNSFQLKETGQFEVMRAFYGDLAWNIILYLTLPLAVFFRFHSVVCLSDIWIEAYKKRCHSVFKMKPEEHTDHDHKHEKNPKRSPSTSTLSNLASFENYVPSKRNSTTSDVASTNL